LAGWVSSAWVVHRVWGESGRLILRGYAQIAGRTHPTLGHRLWQKIRKPAVTSGTGARPQAHKRGTAKHRVLGFGRRPICAYPRSMRPPSKGQNPPPQLQREDSLTPKTDTKQSHRTQKPAATSSTGARFPSPQKRKRHAPGFGLWAAADLCVPPQYEAAAQSPKPATTASARWQLHTKNRHQAKAQAQAKNSPLC